MNQNEKEIFIKICRFCAYRERCESEVKEKLHTWEIEDETIRKILALLIDEGFVNDQRFAKMYALGKHRNNQWGRQKIYQGLKEKKISNSMIQTALLEIEDDEYLETLNVLMTKKHRKTKAENIYQLRQKIATYLIGKGYEAELVWETLKEKIK